MRSPCSIWVGPKSNDKCPQKKHTGTEQEKTLTAEAEIGGMPGATRNSKWQGPDLPESLQMKPALPPRFWTSGFHNCEGIFLLFYATMGGSLLLELHELLHYPSAICNRLYIPGKGTVLCVSLQSLLFQSRVVSKKHGYNGNNIEK